MSVEETVPPREQEQPETAGSVARDRPGETPRKVLSENRDEKLSAKAEAATGEKPKGRGFRPDKRRASHRSTRFSTPTICSATTRCCAGRFAIMDCCHAPRTVESIDGSNAVQRRKQLR